MAKQRLAQTLRGLSRRFSLLRWFGVRRSTGFLLLAALIALRIWDPPPLENLRLRSFDFYQVVKPRVSTFRPVVIVDIDEESLGEFGQWPWPRTLLADLTTQLRKLGSVAIAFDIIFAEPDRMSPATAAEAIKQLDEETRAKLRSLPSNDEVFADAMKGGKVVLGQSGTAMVLPQPTTPMPQTGFAMMGPDPSPFLVTFDGYLRNIPVLEQAAAGRGLLTVRTERDGIARRLPLVMKASDAIVPAITLEMLRVVTNAGAIVIKTDAAGIRSVAVPGLELPTDRNGQLWIHFSEHDPRRYVSAKDVLRGKIAADRIAGKLVLVGTSAVGLLDLKATPVDASMPGVEVQAQILENALTRSVLSYPGYSVAVELLVALLVGIAVIILAPLVGALTLLMLGVGVAGMLVAVSWFFYANQGLLLDLSFPLLASFAIYITLVFINYFREQKDRKRIRSAFGQYLSPALVEQLAQSPEKLVLGGEERNMTILFSDVRGFTTISETYKDDPQGLTLLMNRLLTPLTNSIIDKKGTIDKYIGDAIMAFWNAPLDDPAHEIHSCEAALDMLRRMDALDREREREAKQNGVDFIPIRIGVGINTGKCVVGNMGSDLRFDYSVLGDPVNLASRLESRSKSYGLQIVIGANTADRIGDKFAALELDLITVKGKTRPERVYTLLGADDVARSDDFQKLREWNDRMLACYRRQDWSGATEALQRALHAPNNFGLTEVYTLYSARIAAFQDNAPPADWDGVFAFDTK